MDGFLSPVERKFALIFATLSCAWIVMEGIVLRATQDPSTGDITSALAPLVPILVLWFAIAARKDQELGGTLSWGQGFLSGFKVVTLGALALGFFTIIYHLALDPRLMELVLELTPEEQLPEELVGNPQGLVLMMAAFSVVFTIAFGALISAVVALIQRSR
ncbi:MAG: DUF4199 domain-containing protein [Acidobacteriota bacterium]